MVSVGDKALLFRTQDMMWLEESSSPSVGDKGFLVRTEDGNFFLKKTSVSVGNKARMFNIDGQNYLRSKKTEAGKLKWSVNCSDTIYGIKVTSDGTIFVGTDWQGPLMAINFDGSVKWRNFSWLYQPADVVISSDETKIYAGYTDGYLRCYNTANGTEIWNWSKSFGQYHDFYGGLVIDIDDNIYGGSDSIGVVSLDKDGNFRWENSTVCGIDYHLALDDNQLYVPQMCGGDAYCAVDLNSGEINWSAGIDSGIAVEYYNNRVYYGNYNELDCTTTDGGLIYRYAPIDQYVEDIIVDTNDNCYFFENRGSWPNYSTGIKKLDSDGNLVWTKNMTRQHCINFGPHAMVIDSNNLYVSTQDWQLRTGNAFSIKLSDGTINWSRPLTDGSESGGALSPSKDMFYFGSGQYLYAIEI